MPAPLWNNTAAAPDAERLNGEADFTRAVGTRLVASITLANPAHTAHTTPDVLATIDAVCLPMTYPTFRLAVRLTSDRGDASSTGRWSPADECNRRDLLVLAAGSDIANRLRLPDVLGPAEAAGHLQPDAADQLGLRTGILVGPGTGTIWPPRWKSGRLPAKWS